MAICKCGKESYTSRIEANRALRILTRTQHKRYRFTELIRHDRGMEAYQCTYGSWHYGHADVSKSGDMVGRTECVGCGRPFRFRQIAGESHDFCFGCRQVIRQSLREINS